MSPSETRVAAALTELQDFIELRAQHHLAELRRKWAPPLPEQRRALSSGDHRQQHAEPRCHDDRSNALLIQMPYNGGVLNVYSGRRPPLVSIGSGGGGGAGGAASSAAENIYLQPQILAII